VCGERERERERERENLGTYMYAASVPDCLAFEQMQAPLGDSRQKNHYFVFSEQVQAPLGLSRCLTEDRQSPGCPLTELEGLQTEGEKAGKGLCSCHDIYSIMITLCGPITYTRVFLWYTLCGRMACTCARSSRRRLAFPWHICCFCFCFLNVGYRQPYDMRTHMCTCTHTCAESVLCRVRTS
jgi:hypothetical protein